MTLMQAVLNNGKLGAYEKLTLLLLVSITNPKQPTCSMSLKKLADQLSCSIPTARRCVYHLQDHGAIRVEQTIIAQNEEAGMRNGPNLYTVNYDIFSKWT